MLTITRQPITRYALVFDFQERGPTYPNISTGFGAVRPKRVSPVSKDSSPSRIGLEAVLHPNLD